jgi:DNA-binding MarR family transcriptional regulator
MVKSLLQSELKQTRPFRLMEEEALLNVQRTGEMLRRPADVLMKEHGLSPSSYNVLRILRGSYPDGLPCHEISGRMVSHVPDITRLTDRLLSMGLVERERSRQDRRVVLTRATPRGIELVNSLDEPLSEIMKLQLGHMSEAELATLIRLLEKARTPPDTDSTLRR